jgi:hypothetical protein
MRACGATPVTDTTLKDVLALTADLTTAELAEALGALRFPWQEPLPRVARQGRT